MSNKSPAFQFYPADFLIGCMGMSDEDVGVYMKMLAAQWLHESLPFCKKSIKKMINSRKVPSEIVMRKFELCDDGFLRNSRLEKEREKQKSFVKSRSENAKERWNKPYTSNARASTVHEPSTSTEHALHTSSSSSSSEYKKKDTLSLKTTSVPPPETPWPASASERGGGMDSIMKRINSLRPEWQLPAQWNVSEMHALHGGAASQISELTDADWHDLTAYMATKGLTKDFWQPRSRLKFVETFSDVCVSLQRWRAKEHHQSPSPHKGIQEKIEVKRL